MSEGNLIHIRLDYEEAFDTKKSILSSQMYLLKLLRNIENYKFLKTEEFQYKQKILKKIKETKINIRALEKILPKTKIPKSLRHRNEDPEKENFKVKSRNKSIEGQLSEIKRKLDNLQRKNLELI
jgi:hypothetical protein